MNLLKKTKQILAGLVAVTFFVTNTLSPAPVAYAQNIELLNPSHGINIPAEWGRVTDLIVAPQPASLLIHIREPHTNYDAQKNIQKILHHLNKHYGVELILLEGAGNQIRPELFRFFPKDKELDQAITEELMKRGDLTGAEVFLADTRDKKTEGYGIENIWSYAEDRAAFQKVFEDRPLADDFLQIVYLAWQKQASLHLNKDLREFLFKYVSFQEERTPLKDWLQILRTQTQKTLELDLGSVHAQTEWPVLARYFRLNEIDALIDQAKVLKEKQEFLKEAAAYIFQNARPQNHEQKRDSSATTPEILLKEVEALLATGKNKDLPVHQTRFIFEKLMDLLPRDYSFDAYPNLRLYIQHLILLSELQGDRLQNEIHELTKRMVDVLVLSEDEKRLTGLLRQYQLIKKLFYLELSREEFQTLQDRDISPDAFIKKLHLKVSDLSKINALFGTAILFYMGAIDRENWMMYNAVERMRERKQSRAVIITGGFHTDGIKQKVMQSRSSYIQITPTVEQLSPDDEHNYLRMLLGSLKKKSSAPSAETPQKQAGWVNPAAVAYIAAALSSDIPFIRSLPHGGELLANRRSEMRETGRQVIASQRPEQFDELFPGYEQQLAKIFQEADAANAKAWETLGGDPEKDRFARSEMRVKVLIVDDDASIQRGWQRLFMFSDYEAVIAGSVEEALAAYREAEEQGAPFDVGLFDWDMQEKNDGGRLAQQVGMPVIFSSGTLSEADQSNSSEAGKVLQQVKVPYSIVPKPADQDDLFSAIEKMTARSEIREADAKKKFLDFFPKPDGSNLEMFRKQLDQIAELSFNVLFGVNRIQGRSGPSKPVRELEKLFSAGLPAMGESLPAILDQIRQDIIENSIRLGVDYHAHVVNAPLPIAVFTDLLISASNLNNVFYETSGAATLVELQLVRWMAQLVGYDPDQAGGVVLSGGAASNLESMIVARSYAVDRYIRKRLIQLGRDPNEAPDPKELGLIGAIDYIRRLESELGLSPEEQFSGNFVVLVSPTTHSSIKESAQYAGIGSDSIDWLKTKDGKIDLDDLEAKIQKHRELRNIIVSVVAVAGTTEEGKYDPIEGVVQAARKDPNDPIWVHVDAAYGGAVLFSEKYKHLAHGIEQADSITLDPHKLMYMPYAISVVLYKDDRTRDYLEKMADYGVREDEQLPNLTERSMPWSKRFDALKLWVALKFLGKENYGKLIDHTFDEARRIAEEVSQSLHFELISAPETNQFAFRFVPHWIQKELDQAKEKDDWQRIERLNKQLNRTNIRLIKKLQKDGFWYFARTKLSDTPYSRDGKYPESNKLTVIINAHMNPFIEKEVLERIYVHVRDEGYLLLLEDELSRTNEEDIGLWIETMEILLSDPQEVVNHNAFETYEKLLEGLTERARNFESSETKQKLLTHLTKLRQEDLSRFSPQRSARSELRIYPGMERGVDKLEIEEGVRSYSSADSLGSEVARSLEKGEINAVGLPFSAKQTRKRSLVTAIFKRIIVLSAKIFKWHRLSLAKHFSGILDISPYHFSWLYPQAFLQNYSEKDANVISRFVTRYLLERDKGHKIRRYHLRTASYHKEIPSAGNSASGKMLIIVPERENDITRSEARNLSTREEDVIEITKSIIQTLRENGGVISQEKTAGLFDINDRIQMKLLDLPDDPFTISGDRFAALIRKVISSVWDNLGAAIDRHSSASKTVSFQNVYAELKAFLSELGEMNKNSVQGARFVDGLKTDINEVLQMIDLPTLDRSEMRSHPIAIKEASSREEMILSAAEIFRQTLTENTNPVFFMPTGNTPKKLYQKLAEWAQKGEIDLRKAVIFMLDEYWQGDDYFNYIRQNFLNLLPENNRPKAVHVLNGKAEDPAAEAEKYETLIRQHGGIDLAVLGIGITGHIAFNEPGSSHDSRTRLVPLHEGTIKRNTEAAEKGYTHGLTVGIGTILDAKKIILLASNADVAPVLSQAIQKVPTEQLPVTALKMHADATMILAPEVGENVSALRSEMRSEKRSDVELLMEASRMARDRDVVSGEINGRELKNTVLGWIQGLAQQRPYQLAEAALIEAASALLNDETATPKTEAGWKDLLKNDISFELFQEVSSRSEMREVWDDDLKRTLEEKVGYLLGEGMDADQVAQMHRGYAYKGYSEQAIFIQDLLEGYLQVPDDADQLSRNRRDGARYLVSSGQIKPVTRNFFQWDPEMFQAIAQATEQEFHKRSMATEATAQKRIQYVFSGFLNAAVQKDVPEHQARNIAGLLTLAFSSIRQAGIKKRISDVETTLKNYEAEGLPPFAAALFTLFYYAPYERWHSVSTKDSFPYFYNEEGLSEEMAAFFAVARKFTKYVNIENPWDIYDRMFSGETEGNTLLPKNEGLDKSTALLPDQMAIFNMVYKLETLKEDHRLFIIPTLHSEYRELLKKGLLPEQATLLQFAKAIFPEMETEKVLEIMGPVVDREGTGTMEQGFSAPRSELRGIFNLAVANATQVETPEEFFEVYQKLGGGSERAVRYVTDEIMGGIAPLLANAMTAVRWLVATVDPVAYAQNVVDITVRPEVTFDPAQLATARTMLGIKTVKTSDAFILGPEFALDRGAIGAIYKLLGDTPLIVLTRDNGQDTAFIQELNLELAQANRQPILMASDLNEARAKVRRDRTAALTLRAMVYATEPLAVMLKEQLKDDVILVTPRMFQNFLNLAGVSKLVEKMQGEYLALARSA